MPLDLTVDPDLWRNMASLGHNGLIAVQILKTIHNGALYLLKSNHRKIGCWFNILFKLTTKKHQSLELLAFCKQKPPVCGGFPSERDNSVESFSMW